MDKKQYVGIDIGGSFIKAGLVIGDQILHKVRVPTPKGNAQALFEVLFTIIDNIKKETPEKIDGIGIGVAGLVINHRELLYAVNLGLENVDIADVIEHKYKIPVRIGNDVAMFALAEQRHSKIDNLVYIAIGTGVNAGVINNGKLFSGANGISLEYGHTHITPEHTVGHFISGKALERTNRDIPQMIFYLKLVLVNIINTYRPEVIFIGGGVAEEVEPYIDEINANIKSKNYGYKNAPPVTVTLSRLSADGAILGAASLFA